MYQVRTAHFIGKKGKRFQPWKVVAIFPTFKEAHVFGVKLDFAFRKDSEKEFDAIDIKNTETNERFFIC